MNSLILRPTLHKSAVVTFTQQIKTIDSNNVFDVLFPKCVAHKKKSCVYLSTSPYIHSFSCGMRELDHITIFFFKSTSIFNFSKLSGHCR